VNGAVNRTTRGRPLGFAQRSMSIARLALLGALAAALAVAGSAVARSELASQAPRPSSTVFGIPLVVPCGFSHRNHDDPIVYPKQRGRSHDHTFFGNRSTNAFSTHASLRAHNRSTCGYVADTAAYWAPTLFVGRRAVTGPLLVATYTRRTSARVVPYPAGLKMVAGDANARSAQGTDVVYWSCARVAGRRSSAIPTCPRRGLQLNLRFPDCWDGTRLDSPDHTSHMAYSSNAACPSSHPVAVPSLAVLVTYPVTGGPQAKLSSGRFGTHGDFLNAWDQGTFAGYVDRYFNDAIR
jgi:Domain of unknown function (DUF1996)